MYDDMLPVTGGILVLGTVSGFEITTVHIALALLALGILIVLGARRLGPADE